MIYLQQIRKQRGISMEFLARRLNVATMTIWRWEQGSINPKADRIKQLSETLGVSLNALLDGNDENA